MAAIQNTRIQKQYVSLRHSKCFMATVVTLFVSLILSLFGWLLLIYHPVTSPTPAPTPAEHQYFTLPAHELPRRAEFFNNTFIQMLHHHQLIMNTSNCWVCGLMPHSMIHPVPFFPYPFSISGSCLAWWMLMQDAYTVNGTANSALGTFWDDFWRNRSGHVNAPFCPTSSSTSLLSPDELCEMVVFNSTNRQTFSRFRTRIILPDERDTVNVINVQGRVCIHGLGTKKVGTSTCDITKALNSTSPPKLVASPNTYFICGTAAYTWLPRNWSGSCYLAFLLPPTYSTHAGYHLSMKGALRRLRRGVISAEDTAGQETEDFFKGFLPFWGPMANSRLYED
ncbi:uncharacterized protein LOC144772008 [Lissotriton helveticus]